MMRGGTYIEPMCILYCILHIRLPVRCAVVAGVSGHGVVFQVCGGSGLAKIGFKRLMPLTPVIIMGISSGRSVQCARNLVKIRGNMHDLLFAHVTSYYMLLALR